MSRKPDQRATTLSLSPEKVDVIRAQLERILASHLFRGSKRCQNLLRHVAEQTLAGDPTSLKERTLGIEVFQRAPDYDTSLDPVVRATAAEIRKKLAQYYQEPGHEIEPRIELPPGSYAAEFHLDVPHPPAPAPVAIEPNGATASIVEHHKNPSHPWRNWKWIALSVAAAAVVVAVLTMAAPKWGETELQRLWKPLLDAPGTVIVSLGQPIVYNLRSVEAQDALQGVATVPPKPEPQPDYILKKDLVILPDRYAALGDVICLVHLASMFEKHGKPYRIRGERSTTYADLRETPSVLIGAFDNQWTLHAAGELRFTFMKDDANDTDWVRDRQHPDNTEWRLTGAWPYWDVKTDYAIVSRILNTTTDRPVVIAAGITHYGTMSAGEFLSNPEYFAEVVPKMPRGWEKKNLQIVLRVPVVNRVGGHPQVLAVHVW